MLKFLLTLSIIFIAVPSNAAGKVTFALSGDPKAMDIHAVTGVLESHVIGNILEGLVEQDEKSNPLPAMAERWSVSPDLLTYTFHLRDANWQDGSPVTSEDFAFAWRRCLAPETAAQYAYQLYPIAGAEEYNKSEASDPNTVQIDASTSNVLKVTLKSPTPYFLSVLSHTAFLPLPAKWVKEHPDWATNTANYPSNGPFKLSEWKHRSRILLSKNPAYYDAQSVELDEIVMPIIANESTALLEWEKGNVDIIETSIPLPDVPRLQKEGKLKAHPYLGVYYIALQHERKPLDNPLVRRALALTVNREQLTKAILRGGQLPAYGIVPPGIEMEGIGDFREGNGKLFKEDIAEAKRLLAQAGYPNGRGMPRIRFLFNDLQMHRTIAEALQRMWLENLGVRIDLQVQEWKTYIQSLQSKNFQMARAGWIADFVDPAAFLDMFQTGAGNNHFNYSSPEFDKLLVESRTTTDTALRNELMKKAETVLIQKDMTVIPVYYYVNNYLQNPKVKGVVRTSTSGIYFKYASRDN